VSTVLEKTIEIIFQGDDRTGDAMGRVVGNMGKLESAVTSVTGPLAAVADTVLKLEAALFGMSAGALVYSISAYADYEDVMLRVKGVMGANEEQYARLTSVTRELGATTRYTAAEAAEGLLFLGMAGFKVDEAIGALPSVLQLAAASATDLGRSADILTNIMTGYGIGVSDLVRVNDVLVATFTNSNTSLDELGQAFKYVGPIAKALGLEIEETAAILGILADAGYKADMGGTALRNILIALVEPSSNMSKMFEKLGVDTSEFGVNLASSASALQSLGVTVKDSNGELRPFADIMDDIRAGLEKIPDPADRAAILMEIFGKRGGPQMAALLEQGGDAVRDLMDKIWSLGGVAEKIAEEMESGMGGAIRVLKSSMAEMSIAIGAAVSGDLKNEVVKIAELFRAVAAEVDKGTFDPIVDAIIRVARDFGDYAQAIAQALPEALQKVKFDGFVRSMDDLVETVKRLFGAVFPENLTTAEGLAAAIQKIVNAWETLNTITSGILESWEPVFRALGQLIEQLGDSESALSRWATEIGNLLGGAQIVDTLINKFGLLGAAAASSVIQGLDPATKAGGHFANTMIDGTEAVDAMEGSLGTRLINSLRNYGSQAGSATDETKALENAMARVPEDKKINISAERVEHVQQALERLGIDINSIPEEKLIALYLAKNVGEWNAIIASLNEIPEEKTTEVKAEPDKPSIDATGQYIENKIPDETTTEAGAEADEPKIDEAGKKLNVLSNPRGRPHRAQS
jgi:TP901 family phage tail tape measure protein